MPITLKTSRSLSFRINATIWTVCAALLVVFIFFLYGLERQQLNTHIDQSRILLEALFQQKRELLANEIFANQREALILTMTEISKVKGISGVHLFDMQGRLMEWVGGGQKTDRLVYELFWIDPSVATTRSMRAIM